MCEVEKENAKLKEEVEELKKQLVALYRSYEAKKPYICCNTKCKDRKCYGREAEG